MRRVGVVGAVLGLLLVACGSGDSPSAGSSASPAPATTTPVSAAATSSSTALPDPADAPMTAYRFTMSVGLTDDPGSEPVRPLSELSGESTTDPRALRIFGEFGDGSLDLATDGKSWWDLDDPGLDLAADDVEFLLGANAYLLPATIAPLLADGDEWSEAGIEEVAGVTATKRQRLNIMKDRDWEYGDLVRLDVWESGQGQLLKFTAWFATGDNSGFPVTSWQITEPVPGLVIGLPEG